MLKLAKMAEKAISFYKGQIVVRSQDQTRCVHHKSEILDWFCETCYDVICAKCVSTSHKGHDNILLSEVTLDNKRKIKSFINETEQKELIGIQQEIISTQHSLDEDLNHFESVAEEVKEQGEKLKKDIDVLISETLSRLKHLEEENTKLLTSYSTELEKILADLKEQLTHCKETLQTGTDIQVFNLSKGLQTNITLPEKPKLGSAKFTPNNRRNIILKEAFGKVSLRPSEQSQSTTGPDQSDETSVDDNPLPSGHQQSVKGSTDTGQYQKRVLPPQIKIISEWESPCRINAMCPKSGGGVWTSPGSKMTHLNCQGEIQQEIKSPVYINDITLSPTTHNLWACSSGKLTRRFKTKDKPRCLCITRDGYILVGTKHRITEYTPEGKPGIATKTYLFKKPKVRSPQSISQCPINDNVAVVDRDDADDGGKDKPTVIVLDRQLQQLYRYGESQHYSGSMSLAFRPWDVTYDSLGLLVIADLANKGLHLLSGDGQYLRLLYTDLACPLAVLVDTEGVLWAVFGLSNTDQKVKRLQYTSV
ncbi:E3 ubiquitin-protein ligase TRIM71-like [Mizuhopecten yessoensis]|uniref:E3 ubiquitin-protein ligase TRIM71-like n=1 Tax=Mizuhopecten yessoensis TaxID=6573 RepID=UPI000B458B76|nr:E3 ubiquitin-protein ligase TRIM71-like [Mizuhopecten yessoensis]XP_021353987.1 E3 ubiquitin-protein ligase TRIM71-like [Mizuhopecten yessoensis]